MVATDGGIISAMKRLSNVHPGGVLREAFLLPLNISPSAPARAIGVPRRRANEIVLGKRTVTADTPLRPAKAFGTSAGFWPGLQADYDIEETHKAMAADPKKVERPVGLPKPRGNP